MAESEYILPPGVYGDPKNPATWGRKDNPIITVQDFGLDAVLSPTYASPPASQENIGVQKKLESFQSHAIVFSYPSDVDWDLIP